MLIQEKSPLKTIIDLLMVTLGCGIYALGFVKINMANQLAEGGVTGITLILYHLVHLDPAISTLAINIPLIIIGYKFLGRRALIYTVWGTITLSAWIWLWQRLPFEINIHHDLFISGVLAGLVGGFGSGITYRFGGTTGGSDVVARILEKHRGISMGQSLLVFDAIVLTASLSYIDLRKMMYTLLASYVFAQVVNFTQEGAYTGHGFLIMSAHNQEIADTILAEMNRGVTFLKSQGAYSKQDGQALYCVVSAHEAQFLRDIVSHIDPKAFVSVFDVTNVSGEGFTYWLPGQKKNR